ncbi:amidohydrolase family protein [Mycobacterium sp. 236(2023)]|uniref:amidohydrolase family protein n=1 Tax=Mycobacterium sp. 236(2023) TaxID=3038163 RepID=UPI0024155A2E|nr:amidohydrolase family protein [Mycobacterium sp. 236(2023)]MDG4667604.1 amidohydrolase family protein [Mycobacterium sp. 236(2023)]
MANLDESYVLDIHTHWRPADWRRSPSLTDGEADPREDLDALAAESVANGVSARALSAPVEQLFGPHGDVATADVNVVNEHLAEIVGKRQNFLGLATVDAYAGDAGAEQARYAIDDLGLHGIVLDSARHGTFLGSPEALPTLELAALRGVPVFVHPVAAPQVEILRAVAGKAGNSAGRGLQNAVAFLSALNADLPTRLPDLHLVFTTLGHGGLLYAAEQLARYRAEAADGTLGANLYFDTMRFSAPVLRYLGDVLGPDRLVVGSDWPIHRDAERAHIDTVLAAAGFSAADQHKIRIGNSRRLFGLRATSLAA